VAIIASPFIRYSNVRNWSFAAIRADMSRMTGIDQTLPFQSRQGRAESRHTLTAGGNRGAQMS
jgi:hypothetical protein